MWYDPAPTVDYPTTFVDIYEFLNLAMSSRSLTTCAQSKIIHRVLSTPKSDRGLGIAFASESTSVLPEFRRLTSLPGRLVYGARGADYSLSLASLAPVLLILFSAWFLTEYFNTFYVSDRLLCQTKCRSHAVLQTEPPRILQPLISLISRFRCSLSHATLVLPDLIRVLSFVYYIRQYQYILMRKGFIF